MRLVRLAFQRETAIPMMALLFASATSVVLVVARILWTKDTLYTFLIWNLFLAWLPRVFALLACEKYRNVSWRSWGFAGWAAAWLLFFPNSPYIFTDLTHLNSRFYPHFWADLSLVLLCATIGLVLGFVSLFLMQGVVARMLGRTASWLFIGAVAALSGMGIYMGRFLRFNSWDVFFKPRQVYHGVGHWVANPAGAPNSLAFPAFFATFLFLTYLMLYALTHLQSARLEEAVKS